MKRFALGRFSRSGGAPFVGLVVGEAIHRLDETYPATLDAMLLDWDHWFAHLAQIAGAPRGEPLDAASLRYHPPVTRPGKMLHSAANYAEHVAEMAAYNVAAGADPDKRFTGEKTAAQPYLFLKAPSALAGAFDDIILPDGVHQIDWEAELAVVIGRTARRVSADRALDHVAGYMTTNDVTCRDMLWREDRPNFKTDWLGSKSHDNFAPMGPLFVPAAFVPDPGRLRITLAVNGVVKQDGNTGEMIFSAQEQIAFASGFMTLHPGDIFATGTVGGVGQATGEFLKAGDIVETSVEGLGTLRNRIVAAA